MLRKLLYLALVLVALVVARPAMAQAVNWSFDAGDTQQTEEDEDIENWDSEILNITVVDPGVLSLATHGTRFTGASGTEDLCGAGTRSLSGGWFPQQNGSSFSIPVRPGDYVIELEPHGAGHVSYRVQAELVDVCGMASGDDHGNIPACATELCIDVPQSAELGSYTPADYDYFTFVLASTTAVTIASTSSTDVSGELFDEDGHSLAVDDGVDDFSMNETLGPGRYFVKAWGYGAATGEYSVEVY